MPAFNSLENVQNLIACSNSTPLKLAYKMSTRQPGKEEKKRKERK